MIDISVSGLVKSFDREKNVLDGISFQIQSGERVGLLGPNGAGKTTLFKILTGEYDYNAGEVVIGGKKRLGLISQIPVYPEGFTVDDVLHSAFSEAYAVERQMRALEERLAVSPDDASTEAYGRLQTQFETLGGYEIDLQVNKIANGLSISPQMRARAFASLSGGEKTRINLARLMIENTEILLLDEPTNHLDLHAIEWLEGYLAQYKGTAVIISHDRYFLDHTVTRIIEIENGKAEFYPGNYSFYVAERQARAQERLRRYEKEQKELHRLEEAAARLRLWAFLGNDKIFKRAQSMEKRMDRLVSTDRPASRKTLHARFEEKEFAGDEVFSVKGLSKAYGEKTLFHGVELLVRGGERIALIGDNGCGKTTFLRILMGQEAADSGRVKWGPSVRKLYLPQQVVFPDENRTLLDTMLYAQNCSTQSARNRLAAYLFFGDDVFKRVRDLSGGERSRLWLCANMQDEVNLLLLDEPTNHLDMDSKEWLESALDDFSGTLLFVSHDRYFIDRFATRVLELSDGEIRDWQGDFQSYLRAREASGPQSAAKGQASAASKPETASKQKKQKSARGRVAPEKQLAALEREIARLEAEKARLEEEIAAASFDYQKLEALLQEKETLEAELGAQYAAWEAMASAMEE